MKKFIILSLLGIMANSVVVAPSLAEAPKKAVASNQALQAAMDVFNKSCPDLTAKAAKCAKYSCQHDAPAFADGKPSGTIKYVVSHLNADKKCVTEQQIYSAKDDATTVIRCAGGPDANGAFRYQADGTPASCKLVKAGR